jgi:hypothetical protein
MGFIVRLHESSAHEPKLIGRAASAAGAFALLCRWREDHPESWIEIVPPHRNPRPEAA